MNVESGNAAFKIVNFCRFRRRIKTNSVGVFLRRARAKRGNEEKQRLHRVVNEGKLCVGGGEGVGWGMEGKKKLQRFHSISPHLHFYIYMLFLACGFPIK